MDEASVRSILGEETPSAAGILDHVVPLPADQMLQYLKSQIGEYAWSATVSKLPPEEEDFEERESSSHRHPLLWKASHSQRSIVPTGRSTACHQPQIEVTDGDVEKPEESVSMEPSSASPEGVHIIISSSRISLHTSGEEQDVEVSPKKDRLTACGSLNQALCSFLTALIRERSDQGVEVKPKKDRLCASKVHLLLLKPRRLFPHRWILRLRREGRWGLKLIDLYRFIERKDRPLIWIRPDVPGEDQEPPFLEPPPAAVATIAAAPQVEEALIGCASPPLAVQTSEETCPDEKAMTEEDIVERESSSSDHELSPGSGSLTKG
nr:uncharacterized protein LOC129429205 [Misgurnus anguillicaudatus]